MTPCQHRAPASPSPLGTCALPAPVVALAAAALLVAAVLLQAGLEVARRRVNSLMLDEAWLRTQRSCWVPVVCVVAALLEAHCTSHVAAAGLAVAAAAAAAAHMGLGLVHTLAAG